MTRIRRARVQKNEKEKKVVLCKKRGKKEWIELPN